MHLAKDAYGRPPDLLDYPPFTKLKVLKIWKLKTEYSIYNLISVKLQRISYNICDWKYKIELFLQVWN